MSLNDKTSILDIVKVATKIDNNSILSNISLNINPDGSGDFLTIEEAVSSLANKLIIGNIILNLSSGTHIINSGITFNRDNILGRIIIKGQGVNNTILQSNLSQNIFIFTFENGVNSIIQDISFIAPNGNKETTYYGLGLYDFSFLILQNCNFTGLHFVPYVASNSSCTFKGTLNYNKCRWSIVADGGQVTQYGIVFNFTNCGNGFNCWHGGIARLTNSTSNFTNCDGRMYPTIKNNLTSDGVIFMD